MTVPGDNSIDVLTNDVAIVVISNPAGEVEVQSSSSLFCVCAVQSLEASREGVAPGWQMCAGAVDKRCALKPQAEGVALC